MAFMTGFGVSAVHGFPDTQVSSLQHRRLLSLWLGTHVLTVALYQLISFAEMERSAKDICASLKRIPCIGDGDTGYGSAINVKRTVAAYAQAGMAGIMLEDQVAPKRCGHTQGKEVVSRDEAFMRVKAAVDARREGNFDMVIMARTDARATHSLQEAIERCQEFVRLGADITFLEAPRSIEEMREYCAKVPGPKMANMVENGLTPVLLPEVLEEIGYKIVVYPLTLLNASIKVMEQALSLLKNQTSSAQTDAAAGADANITPNAELNNLLSDFEHVKDVVGFNEYYEEEARYKTN